MGIVWIPPIGWKIKGATNGGTLMYYSYPKLKQLEKIGASLCQSCPAMATLARPAAERAISASAFAELLAQGKLDAATTYVSDGAVLVCGGALDGCGATVIAPAGLVLCGISSLKNLNVITEASVTVKDTKGATLENVKIEGGAVALALSDSASEIDLVDCRLVAKKIALDNNSASLNISASYLAAPVALSDKSAGDGLFVNTVFAGNVSLAAVPCAGTHV